MQTSVKLQPKSKTFIAKVSKFDCPNPWALLNLYEQNFVWRDRNGTQVWLALGEFRTTTSLDECREWLSQTEFEGEFTDITLRCFGSAAFETKATLNGIWTGFSTQKYVLPKALLCIEEGTATVFEFENTRFQDTLQTAKEVLHTPQPSAFESTNLFPQNQWKIAVGCIREQILAGNLSKAVLARAMLWENQTQISPAILLDYLLQNSENSFLFFQQTQKEKFFIGSSPERLFRLEKDNLYSESLAGTRPRAISQNQDNELAEELLSSAKDRTEQALVTEYLADTMNSLCSLIKVGNYPNVKRFHTVQHLSTPVEGILRDGVSLDKILESLHPTPAVCGTPTNIAKDLIQKFETVPRGLYSGAVGWVSENEAEFAVGIRSALMEKNKVYLFAGAGIVADSDAEQEYNECSLKMEVMRSALINSAK